MCAVPAVKFGETLGQKRHCSGTNCGIVESGESVDSCGEVGVRLFWGLNDGFIGRVGGCAVVVVVVAVVVSSMPTKLKCKCCN